MDLRSQAQKFINDHKDLVFPLRSVYTELPLSEQRYQYVRVLHKGNEVGDICVSYCKPLAPGEKEVFIGRDGKEHKRKTWFDQFLPIDELSPERLEAMVKPQYNSYIGANPMDGNRGNEYTLGISEMHLDIDILHDMKHYDTALADQVISIVISMLLQVLPAPTMIVLSGRGITWIYRYDCMLRNEVKITYRGKRKSVASVDPDVLLHDKMFGRLITKVAGIFQEQSFIEVDKKIVDHPRVMRHPGTTNVNAGRPAMLFLCEEDRMYDPDDLYEMAGLDKIPDPEENPASTSASKSAAGGKEREKTARKDPSETVDYSPAIDDNIIPYAPPSFRRSARGRMTKIEKLVERREENPETAMAEGRGRHDLLFVYYCHARLIYSMTYSIKLADSLNQKFSEPLCEEEFHHQMERIYSHQEKRPPWYIHGDGTYIFHADTMCDFLRITEEEEKELGFAKHWNKVLRCRANQDEAEQRDYEIAKLWLEGMSAEKISKTLEGKYKYVKLRTVYNTINRLELPKDRNMDLADVDFIKNKRYARKFTPSVEEPKEESADRPSEEAKLPQIRSLSGTCKLSAKAIAAQGAARAIAFTSDSTEYPNTEPCSISDNECDHRNLLLQTGESLLLRDQEYAYHLIESGVNCYIAGQGGSGKSYLIQRYRKEYPDKKLLVLSPSNLAAIGIGGRTIHKALDLSPRPYGPVRDGVLGLSQTQLETLSVDTVVIDEIGQVRFDLFHRVCQLIQAAERALNRRIQVIVMGDYGQLPPVMTAEDKEYLDFYWDTNTSYLDGGTFAFRSPCWAELGLWENTALLRGSKRQEADPMYGYALSQVYRGVKDQDLLDYLNQRVDPGAMYREDTLHICGKNCTVDDINNHCIQSHTSDASYCTFAAKDTLGKRQGDYTVPFTLSMYLGMRVMVTENTKDAPNGIRGTVTKINKASVRILTDNGRDIRIQRQKIRSTKKEREFINQLPLVPAYAVTFHKCQGMTMDSAIIHPEVWEAGQLYTGLSRIRTLAGLILTAPITVNHILSERVAIQVYDYVANRMLEGAA